MFYKNLTYFRQKKGLSKKDLAELVGLSPMAITNYEQGHRVPDLEITRKLAGVLDTTIAELLSQPASSHEYVHCEFRKQSRLPKSKQQLICSSAENYFDRFLTIAAILGKGVLRDVPDCHSIISTGDPECDALRLRELLGFSAEGPISDLVGSLENKGILIFIIDFDDVRFSGMNGLVDGRPYIIVKSNMSAERQRSTLAHELAHVFFVQPEQSDSKWEKYVTAVSGAFLFPKEDAVSELGRRRRAITADMEMVAKEYGISLQMLVKRAQQLGIINDNLYKSFNIMLNQSYGRKNEQSRIKNETTRLFEQLVVRAISEEEITFSRGAELLQISPVEMRRMVTIAGAF